MKGWSGSEGGKTDLVLLDWNMPEMDGLAILGGQVKSLLPEPCRLSLPTVAEGADYAFRGPHDKVLARLAFTCRDAPVRVTIVEGAR